MNFKDKIIKILTLGIGLAIGLVLVAKVCFELSYDKFYDGVENIYSIRTLYNISGEDKDYDQVSGAVAPGFKASIPEVLAGTRTTFFFDSDKFIDKEGNVIKADAILADSCFFDVFPVEILAGDAKKALGTRGGVMVSRSLAEKLGGVSECIGKTICNELYKDVDLTVEGVYEDFPKNGTLHYDMLVDLELYPKNSTENWIGNDRYKGYVRLADGTDAGSLTEAIHKMQEANQPLEEIARNGISLWYYLAPFDKMHTSDKSVKNSIIILGIVALLMLLVSVLNYVLLVISSVVQRSKEVAVRKCYGAESKDIFGLLAKETAVNLALSLVLAAVILLALRGPILNLLGVALGDLFIPQVIKALILVVLLVFAIAVIIPANLYNRIPISSAFRNYTENSRRWKLALLFVQFFTVSFMLLMVLLVSLQYNKAVNGNIGYNPKNVLLFANYSESGMEKAPLIEDAMKAIPEVDDVQFAYNIPYEGSNGDMIELPGSTEQIFNIADQYEASAGWLKLMGVKMMEGRTPETHGEALVSESFVAKMQDLGEWADGAIGKSFAITGHGEEVETDSLQVNVNGSAIYTVCGVYDDYMIGTLSATDDRPSALFYGVPGKHYMPNVFVRVNKVTPEVIDKVQAAAEDVYEGETVQVISMSETIRGLYDDTRKVRNTIFLGSIFALLIALLGLIGYIRNEAGRRSKEMAIRKINGATTGEITGLFVRDILKIALFAVILADIAAFLAARRFLTMFSQKIALNPLLFVAVDILVLAIIVIAVVINCLRISRANPVDSLKSE